MATDRQEDRYSIAYFCHPLNDTKLVRIPSRLVSMRRLEIKEACGDENIDSIMTAAEHLDSRLVATYGWAKQTNPLGGEVQQS